MCLFSVFKNYYESFSLTNLTCPEKEIEKSTRNSESSKNLIYSEISKGWKSRHHLQSPQICKSHKLGNYMFQNLPNFDKFSNFCFPLQKSFIQVMF